MRFEPRAFNLWISSISKEGSSALCWQPARTVNATGTRWYGSSGSVFCYYVVRLYSWYKSYQMVTEARSPSRKADNLKIMLPLIHESVMPLSENFQTKTKPIPTECQFGKPNTKPILYELQQTDICTKFFKK